MIISRTIKAYSSSRWGTTHHAIGIALFPRETGITLSEYTPKKKLLASLGISFALVVALSSCVFPKTDIFGPDVYESDYSPVFHLDPADGSAPKVTGFVTDDDGDTTETITFSPCTAQRAGFVLIAWNSSPDASGVFLPKEGTFVREELEFGPLTGVSLNDLYPVWLETGADYLAAALDDGTAKLLLYAGSESDLVLPSTLDGRTVSSIGFGFASLSDKRLRSLSFPGSIVSIEVGAFRYCSALSSISFADGMREIGSYAFYGCGSLAAISFPSTLSRIGESAFGECDSLTAVDLSAGVDEIDDNAFMYCRSLRNVVLCSSMKRIGDYAFARCTSLVSVSTAGDAPVADTDCSMGLRAFSVCSYLSSVSLPQGIKDLGDMAFAYCGELDDLELPASLVRIGADALTYTGKLRNLAIPSTLQTIGDHAFCMSGIDALVLPATLVSIGSETFVRCMNLSTLTIENAGCSIEEDAFNAIQNRVTIQAPAGGAVQAFCEAHGIAFQAIP